MTLKVVSEGIPTHVYESKTLTKAFEDITGIKVQHQIIGEGDVVMAITTSPSPMIWCCTLMPVMSSNAFVRVLDSYT